MKLKKIFFPRAYQYEDTPYSGPGEINCISRDGNSLDSIFFTGNNSDKLVILCHPYLVEAKDYFISSGHIDIYLELDCDVVVFDFNGFGKSEDIDIHLHKDIHSVVSFYLNRKQYHNLYAHGLSMGASLIINAIQDKTEIDQVIIENCLDTNFSYFKKRNLSLYRLLKIIDLIIPSINKRNAYYKEVGTIYKGIKKIMYLYNDEDDLTTVEMGKLLHKNTNLRSSFHILRGSHLTAIHTDPITYKNLINGFITE